MAGLTHTIFQRTFVDEWPDESEFQHGDIIVYRVDRGTMPVATAVVDREFWRSGSVAYWVNGSEINCDYDEIKQDAQYGGIVYREG